MENKKSIIDYITKIVEILVIILAIVMTVSSFAQVILRYFFNYTIIWAEELARYTFVWCIFLSSALLTKDDTHTNIDYFINKIFKSKVFLFQLFINVLLMVVLIALTYFGINIVKNDFGILSSALRIPIAFVSLSFIVSAVLMIVYLIINSFNILQRRNE